MFSATNTIRRVQTAGLKEGYISLLNAEKFCHPKNQFGIQIEAYLVSIFKGENKIKYVRFEYWASIMP